MKIAKKMSLEDIYGRGRTRTRDEKVTEDDGKWSGGPKLQAIFEPGISVQTVITKSLTDEQIKAITALGRTSEIERILKTDSYVPNERNRSPSPAPVYNSKGQRTNTREQRYKKKFTDERDELILELLHNVPEYEAPFWYRRMKHITDKLFVPTDEHPEINFMGLLIGPRGNTLRRIERESGAKIGLRGKGSVKGGNANSASSEKMLLEEPLHCQIVADTREQVAKAKKLCQEVIDKAIYSGPGENDFKRSQLKELAILNGTLREESEHICSLCGEKGHTRHDCPNKKKIDYVNTLVCSKCGNVGHLAKDCRLSFDQNAPDGASTDARRIADTSSDKNQLMDDEFASMMRDLNGEDEPEKSEEPKDQHDEQRENGDNQSYPPVIPPGNASQPYANESLPSQANYQHNHRPDYRPGSGSNYHQDYRGNHNGYHSEYNSASYGDNRSRPSTESRYQGSERFSDRRHDPNPAYSRETYGNSRSRNGPGDYGGPQSSFNGPQSSFNGPDRFSDRGYRNNRPEWRNRSQYGNNRGYSRGPNRGYSTRGDPTDNTRSHNGGRYPADGDRRYEAPFREDYSRGPSFQRGNYSREMPPRSQNEYGGFAPKRHYDDDRASDYGEKRHKAEYNAPQAQLQAPPGFHTDRSVSRHNAPPPPSSSRPKRPPPPPGSSK